MPHPTRPLALLLVGVLVGVLLAACSPGTPDEDSWRVDAIRAVGDVSSSVATMQLALRHDDRIFGPYLQTMAVDSERSASGAADKLSSHQPPDPYLKRYHHVTRALGDAESLLARARIAVVRHDDAAFADLAQRLSRTSDRLDRIEDALRALPDDRYEP